MTERTGEPVLTAQIESIADLLMDLRMDGPSNDGWTYQQTMRHYAEIIVRDLTPSQPDPSGLDELREAAQAVLVELDIIRRHWNTTSKAMLVHRDTQEALRSALGDSNR